MGYQYHGTEREGALAARVYRPEQVRQIVQANLAQATSATKVKLDRAQAAQKGAEVEANKAKRRLAMTQDRVEALEQDLKSCRAELTTARTHHTEQDAEEGQAAATLKAELDEARGELAEAQASARALSTENAHLERDLAKATSKATNTAGALQEQSRRLSTAREEVAALREQLGREREKVGALERSAVVVLAGHAPDSVEFDVAFDEAEQLQLLHRAAASIEILISARTRGRG